MKNNLLKWGNKWDTGRMIFIIIFFLGILLFINRYDLSLESITKICFNEHVKIWQGGIFQLLRSFLEHFSFNFMLPILFVIFSLGFDRLSNQYVNWRVVFLIGAFCSVIITLIWEFQKRPVEWIEVGYDLFAIVLSYLFIKWQLKEFDEKIKQFKKKE